MGGINDEPVVKGVINETKIEKWVWKNKKKKKKKLVIETSTEPQTDIISFQVPAERFEIGHVIRCSLQLKSKEEASIDVRVKLPIKDTGLTVKTKWDVKAKRPSLVAKGRAGETMFSFRVGGLPATTGLRPLRFRFGVELDTGSRRYMSSWSSSNQLSNVLLPSPSIKKKEVKTFVEIMDVEGSISFLYLKNTQKLTVTSAVNAATEQKAIMDQLNLAVLSQNVARSAYYLNYLCDTIVNTHINDSHDNINDIHDYFPTFLDVVKRNDLTDDVRQIVLDAVLRFMNATSNTPPSPLVIGKMLSTLKQLFQTPQWSHSNRETVEKVVRWVSII